MIGSILYGVYTIAGWFGGTALNFFRPKWTMYGSLTTASLASDPTKLTIPYSAFGALGYPFYVGSMWYYDRIGHQAFPLFG